MHKIGEILFSSQTRQKKVELQLLIKNVYQVFRLILLTVITTYFTGCMFYFISAMQNDKTLLNLYVETSGVSCLTVTGDWDWDSSRSSPSGSLIRLAMVKAFFLGFSVSVVKAGGLEDGGEV